MAKASTQIDEAYTEDYYGIPLILWYTFAFVVAFIFLYFRLWEFEWSSMHSISFVVETIIHRYLFL